MLKIYDLNECDTEAQIDAYIESHKSIPNDELYGCSYNINDVVENDPHRGSFYLADDHRCIWWFGPRNSNGIAGQYDYKWFCFRTEDGEYHKFNITDIPHSREAMNKILEWIARGSASDGPVLNLATDEVEFMDI